MSIYSISGTYQCAPPGYCMICGTPYAPFPLCLSVSSQKDIESYQLLSLFFEKAFWNIFFKKEEQRYGNYICIFYFLLFHKNSCNLKYWWSLENGTFTTKPRKSTFRSIPERAFKILTRACLYSVAQANQDSPKNMLSL